MIEVDYFMRNSKLSFFAGLSMVSRTNIQGSFLNTIHIIYMDAYKSSFRVDVRVTGEMSVPFLNSPRVVKSSNSQLSKSISSRGILVNVNTYTRPRTRELAKSVVSNRYLGLLPPQDISPHLALVHGADFHPLLTGSSVTHHACQTVFMGLVTLSNPSDAICLIEVILLVAIGVEFTREDNIWKLAAASWGFRWHIFTASHAIEVTIEDAGVTRTSKKNKAIRERFKEPFDRSGHGLARLGVMVHDRCLVGQPNALMRESDLLLRSEVSL